MERIIMHIDVNNAYLSWTAIELLNSGHKVDIRNEYSVIGGDETKRRGVVLAKSMLAKSKGVVTGETLYSARKKCPGLKTYLPNHQLYGRMSRALFELLSKYTSDIEVISIDECFIDYGKIKHLYGDEISFAYKLKDEIYETLGFTVNIGIANNKLCAKMASDFSKPNKVHTLYEYEIKDKMWPLPVGELYGVGKKTVEKLSVLNINTIKDLATTYKENLYKYFKNQSQYMIDTANGIDNSEVISEHEDPKSISSMITLLYDYTNINEINIELKNISEKLAIELRQKNKYANVVAVIIKNNNFKTATHQEKLKNATNVSNDIYKSAVKLFEETWDKTPIRLIGIRLDSLQDENNYQMSLFENIDTKIKDDKLEQVIDKLKQKYGNKIINK